MLLAPIGVLGWVHPLAAVAATLGFAASTGSNALIQIWYERPFPRSAFRWRTTGSALPTLGGLLAAAGWGVAAAVGTSGTLMTGLIALAVGVLPAGFLALMWLGGNRNARPAHVRECSAGGSASR